MKEADMDQSSRAPPSTKKVHPLLSPRMDQDHRGAIRRSVDKPLHPSPRIPSPSVDYDDVFGGPPRLVASLLASSSSSSSLPPPSPSLNAEKTILSKVPSFRSSRVFELPVFGDDVSPGSTYDVSKTPSSPPVFVYEDIFKENRQGSDVVGGSSSYGNPNSDANSRSRPSSRAGSRRMSPVHPSLATGSEPTHEEASYVKSKLASFTKSRSGGGKVTSKSSFSSFSSIDESRERGFDIPSLLPRSALTSASVPPSPSPQHPLSQFKISAKSSSNNNGPITGIEIDDVFGGFPQKSLLQQRSSNGRDAFRIKSEKKYPNDMFQRDNVVKTPDDFSRKNRPFSRSFSSTEDQASREDLIEIRMHRDGNSRGPEKIGKEWITVNDLHQSTKSSQPDNLSQLQFKSWKDWTASINEKVSGKMEAFSRVSSEIKQGVEAKYARNMAENLSSKNSDDSFTLKQYYDKISTSLSPKSAEETVEMEERELQALLASAWKLNEEREKRKEQSRISRERPNVVELKGQELQPKANRQFKESLSQKSKMDRKNDRFLKRYSDQDKEGVKNSDTLNCSGTVEPSFNNNKVPIENMAEVFVKSDSVVEEDFTVVFEETPTDVSSEITADVGLDGRKQPTTESQTSIELDGGVNADKSADSDELQDVVQLNEEFDISPREEIEDIECFLGLVSSLDGFQEIEGESLERRKSRLERHVRTKERAAKAVEEMQQREAVLRREQEEKQQVAESSDRKIKQWAAGKEGNLRALLSNLQYVLWPESGWKPLPLTSLIEGSDVKKAYRKATLFIHPDKLQHKSATLQQKYIAGRVFDILQEAWKTFNTQELF